MAGRRVHFVMPAELVERIDAALDGESRGEFVRRAVEQALSEAKGPFQSEQPGPGSVSSSEGVRSAAPAEQFRRLDPIPVRHGHVGPKRSFAPVPKGGKS